MKLLTAPRALLCGVGLRIRPRSTAEARFLSHSHSGRFCKGSVSMHSQFVFHLNQQPLSLRRQRSFGEPRRSRFLGKAKPIRSPEEPTKQSKQDHAPTQSDFFTCDFVCFGHLLRNASRCRPSFSDVKGFYNLVSRTWRCNRCQQSRLTQQWLRMPVSIRTRQHLGEKSSPVVLPHAQKRQASAYTRSWAQAVPPGSTSHHVYKCLHWGRLARALPTRCSPGAETAAAWQRLRLRLPTPPPLHA